MRLARQLILISLGTFPTVSSAELSGNFGMVSDYVFRGFYQSEASAFAGLDYVSDSGFYIGTWGGEVTKGIETDLYFGYTGSSGDFGYGIGYGAYFYTDEFDDTYREFSVGVSYGGLSLDIMNGEWGGFGDPHDYSFFSLGYSFESGAYINFGNWGQDFDGSYTEFGYGFDLMGLDLSIALIASSDLPVSQKNPGEDDTADFNIIFGVTKGISFGD